MVKCRFSFETIGNWEGCALTADDFQRTVIECDGSDKQKENCPIWNNHFLHTHNFDFIQFLKDLKVPIPPTNSPNKTEFHNGCVIMKDIILKKLKSLPRG